MSTTVTQILAETDQLELRPTETELAKVAEFTTLVKEKKAPKTAEFKPKIVWGNVAWYGYLHAASLIGLYQIFFEAKWLTIGFAYMLYVMGALGITAGAHRLWAHRSYKANLPYRIILVIFNWIALQNDVIEWARDHRCHHKWSETDADPHNTNRGMFFAHMGWLMTKKHPEVVRKGKKLDLSDLENDPVLKFQQKYYMPFAILICFVLPTLIPWYFWGESFLVSYFVAAMFRYTFLLHVTWCVNSVAHWIGDRPYDTRISPRQSLFTAVWALGEGWHNFHHTFPFDYKTAEVPYAFNFTTAFIDAFALIGWTTDRKVTTPEMVERQRERHGDLQKTE